MIREIFVCILLVVIFLLIFYCSSLLDARRELRQALKDQRKEIEGLQNRLMLKNRGKLR